MHISFFSEMEVERNIAYYVPAILVVLPCVSSTSKSFAKPKSEILGFISSSNKMLLVFRSRCIILRRESS